MFSVAIQGTCVQTALSVEGRWGMIFASLEAEDLEGEGFSKNFAVWNQLKS